MKLAKIAVLFLCLLSLGVILFVVVLVIGIIMIFDEMPVTAQQGPPVAFFFVAFVLIMGVPIGVVPALLAWGLWEREIRPHEAAQNLWRKSAPEREEILWRWIAYVSDLILRQYALRGTANDPLPVLIESMAPRALHELDGRRRERLLLFLRDTGVAKDLSALHVAVDPQEVVPYVKVPRRGPYMFAVSGCSLVSVFFVLWTILAGITVFVTKPMSRIGVELSAAEAGIGLFVTFIPALISGLAAVGLWRIYRRAVLRSQDHDRDSQAQGEVAFQCAVAQIQALDRWYEIGPPSERNRLVRRIAKAVIWVSVSELDRDFRGSFVKMLFDNGWLSGEKTLTLKGTDFRGAELGEASLTGACLAGADLSGANLTGAQLVEARLHGCILRGSDLRSCRFTGADLSEVDLRYARLQEAVLENTKLNGALIEGANFWGACMRGMDLTGAEGSAEYLDVVAGPC